MGDLPRGKGDPDFYGYLGEDNMTTAGLLQELGLNKTQAANLYKEYKKLKEIEDILKGQLMFKLKDSSLKSAKGDKYTASITETPTVVIHDEKAVMEWLKNTPNVEADFYIGIKKPEFSTLAKQMLKETGELANGTDIEVRESLSIRSNK